MGKRLVIAILGVFVAGSTLVGIGDASAAPKPTVNGFGTVQCSIFGKIVYNPPLIATTRPTTATVVAKFACSTGQTGGVPVVTGGKVLGAGTSVMTSCTLPTLAEVAIEIRWKAAGGKVLPSTANLGAGGDVNSFRFTTPNIDAGSYASHPLEVKGTASSPACGKRGIRKSMISGTLDVGGSCDANVLTAPGAYQDQSDGPTDERIWFVVASFCDYLPENHPTGTMSWSRPGPPALCSGSGPIVDTGSNYALHIYNLPPTDQPYTYWGIDTGWTLSELEANCLPGGTTLTYSGDSHFRPFSVS